MSEKSKKRQLVIDIGQSIGPQKERKLESIKEDSSNDCNFFYNFPLSSPTSMESMESPGSTALDIAANYIIRELDEAYKVSDTQVSVVEEKEHEEVMGEGMDEGMDEGMEEGMEEGEEIIETQTEKAEAEAIGKKSLELYTSIELQGTKGNDEKIVMSPAYNPFVQIVALGKKSKEKHNEYIQEKKHNGVFMDCRPFIPITNTKNQKPKTVDDYLWIHNMGSDIDPNIKPMWLLKQLAKGKKYRHSFFWIELMESSTFYEIDQYNKGFIGLREAQSNICFVIHTFLHMSTKLYFKIIEEQSPFHAYDSNNGEMMLAAAFGTQKQVTPNYNVGEPQNDDENVGNYNESRTKFKNFFLKWCNHSEKEDFYVILNDYFGFVFNNKGDKDKGTDHLLIAVTKLWNHIKTVWETDSNNSANSKKDLVSTYKFYTDNHKNTPKKKTINQFEKDPKDNSSSFNEVALTWALNRLFKRHIDHKPPELSELSELKNLINVLIPDMIKFGGGKEAHDMVILYRGDNKYEHQYISVKNINKSGAQARCGKSISTRLVITHMKMNHAIKDYLLANINTSPRLNKLAMLLDMLVNASNTEGNTLKTGIEKGEMGDKLMAVFSFITEQLYIYFFVEFIYFYILFKELFTNNQVYMELLNDEHKAYINNTDNNFNFWKVYGIANEIQKFDESIKQGFLEKCRQVFKNRWITGIDSRDTGIKQEYNEKAGGEDNIKDQLFDLLLKNVVSNKEALHIISILSHLFPIEVDNMSMVDYNNPKNFHHHTARVSQLLRFLLSHEALGSKSLVDDEESVDKYSNTQNSALIIVSEREVQLVSVHHRDNLLTYMISNAYHNESINMTKAHTLEQLNGLIEKWEKSKPYFTPYDGITTSLTQNNLTIKSLVFPISQDVKEALKMMNKSYDYTKLYMRLYNEKKEKLSENHDNTQSLIDASTITLMIKETQERFRNASSNNGNEKQLMRCNSYQSGYALKIINISAIENYYRTFFTKKIDSDNLDTGQDIILKKLAQCFLSDTGERSKIEKSLKALFIKAVKNESYSRLFIPTLLPVHTERELTDGRQSDSTAKLPGSIIKRTDSFLERNQKPEKWGGGKKINTGIKKSFNGKMKNIYKIKGSNSYYIIYNKKLISVKQYKKELLLNKPTKQKQSPSPSPAKPLVDKSNISKYNLRIEQYKNKNLSDYFINKLKTHINDNDDKNNIYKIGIKRIKVILKDIYKINR